MATKKNISSAAAGKSKQGGARLRSAFVGARPNYLAIDSRFKETMGKNVHLSQNFSLDVDPVQSGNTGAIRKDGGIFSPVNNGLASITENHRGNMLLTSHGGSHYG